MTIELGAAGVAELTVSDSDLATALNQQPGGGFPPVLATARMIGLMELAANEAFAVQHLHRFDGFSLVPPGRA